jgi:hypothetical protein
MYTFRIEFDGQCVGPYGPTEAWEQMNKLFEMYNSVTLVNEQTGSHLVATHTEA